MKVIREALARAYCTERNKHKVIDPDLIEDMLTELRKIPLTQEPKEKPKIEPIDAEKIWMNPEGYDLRLNNIICKVVSIPVIASGGCGKAMHMLEVFKKTNVDAALAASIFHYQKYTINKVKKYLRKNNIHVRI